MYRHLKDRSYYEQLYDCHTVEIGRRGRYHYHEFYSELEQKLKERDPPDEISRPGNAILVNAFYMQILGYELLKRYEEREQKITAWMERDRQLDERLHDTNLKHNPPCQHCGQLKLKLYDKMLMSRDTSDIHELVLIFLKCSNCHRISLYWEDGAPYHSAADTDETPAVSSDTPEPPKTTGDINNIHDTYFWNVDPETDPDYAKDRYKFCLYDESELKRLRDTREGIARFAELGRHFAEKDKEKSIDRALKQIKQLTVSELIKTLTPVIEAQRYSNVAFSTPQPGRYLTVEFSCLETDPERQEYQGVRDLKRLINDQLALTNWRLMSTGISYRLGFLSGRLKAIESQDELRALAEKLLKSNKKQPLG